MFLKNWQHIRCYARFVKHRNLEKDAVHEGIQKKAVATVPRPVVDENFKSSANSKDQSIDQSESTPLHDNSTTSKSTSCDSPTSNLPFFSKLKELDGNISRLLTTVKSKKQREKSGHVLLEGKNLIRDAIENGALPEIVLFSRVDDVKHLSLPESGVQLYKIPYKTISMWSDTATCPGIMAILKAPPVHLKKPNKESLPLTVICDNVRDPGNLGAVLRTVAAVGCKQLLLSKGCVDLWEPKVLRSAAGAHFHLPIHRNISLNTLENFVEPNSTVYIADNNVSTQRDDIYASGHRTFDRLVPIMQYYSVDFTLPESLVVIIGGETEGVSDSAVQLACQRQGARLHIPLDNGIESLNTATALSVILFEIKRQICLKIPASNGGINAGTVPLLDEICTVSSV